MAFSSFSPPWLANVGVDGETTSTLSPGDITFAGVRQTLPFKTIWPLRMASLAFTLEEKASVVTRYVSSRETMASQRYAESYTRNGFYSAGKVDRAWIGVLVDNALRSVEETVSYAIMEERTLSSFHYVSA